MKFSAISAAIVLASCVSALELTVTGEGISGGLTITHEGAGLDYAFAGTTPEGQEFTYDEANKDLYANLGGVLSHASLFVEAEFVGFGVLGTATAVTFDGDKLALNGTSDAFYGCKNVNDPYKYSASQYAILYSESAPSTGDCVKVTITKSGDNSTESAGTSVAAATSAAATSVPVAVGGAAQNSVAVGALAAGIAVMAALV